MNGIHPFEHEHRPLPSPDEIQRLLYRAHLMRQDYVAARLGRFGRAVVTGLRTAWRRMPSVPVDTLNRFGQSPARS